MDKKRIHEMLEKMTDWSLSEMQAKGKEGVDTQEMGAVVDMVKDLAYAEKCVWEACYYKCIAEAMKEEEEEAKRYGYDRWRTSSGRFAPKGTGHETSMAMATGRPGYDKDIPWYMRPWLDGGDPNMRLGYSGPTWSADGPREGRPATSGGESGGAGTSKRDLYQDARRYFTEARTPEAKKERDERSKEYVCEAIDTMTDIFREADPTLQKEIKNDLTKLMREFGM